VSHDAASADSDSLRGLLRRVGLLGTLVSGAECYGYDTPRSVVMIFNVCALPLVESALVATLGAMTSHEDESDWPDWLERVVAGFGELRRGQELLWSPGTQLWVLVMPWTDAVTVSVRIGLSDRCPSEATQWLFEAFGVA
jgi:hypothetical protein